MPSMISDDPPRLVVGGLVDRPERYDLEGLRLLGGLQDETDALVVALRRLIDKAGPAPSATHVTARSADGAYSASIPLREALARGEIHVRNAPGIGSPIRLMVPGGMTLCWNVKGLGLLRVTAGPEPDSLPEVLTH